MTDIEDYNGNLTSEQRIIAEALCSLIAKNLKTALGKVWHGHPVWFLDGNPVTGYSLKKAGIEMLFWSGQSFENSGLKAIGSFKAAGVSFSSKDDLDEKLVTKWLKEAKVIQWDYANLPKKKKLEKQTNF